MTSSFLTEHVTANYEADARRELRAISERLTS
jgi:hypothetical protein